jgi:hypothetical protein
MRYRLLCVLALLIQPPVVADLPILSDKVLRMGIHNFPPDFVVSADGKTCAGEGYLLAQRLFSQAGFKLKAVCTTPARMYLLLDQGEVDFSINVKTTAAISKKHKFVEPAYMPMQLMLYSHQLSTDAPQDKTVAAIRSFDYLGQRQQLLQQGYQLVDMPDSISAIQLFLHQRTQHLISYQGPFVAHADTQSTDVVAGLKQKKLAEIDAYFVVSAASADHQRVIEVLQQYAKAHSCSYFKGCR